LARKIVCEDSLVESADAKVSDIVMSEEKRKNFIKSKLYIGRGFSLDSMPSRYRRGSR
jgi:hypothetical protein